MEPITAVILTGSIAAFMYIVCILNFARMGSKMFSSPERIAQHISDRGIGVGFAVHIISGGIASLSTLALIASFIWFLLDKFA